MYSLRETDISIHAPARGATRADAVRQINADISIHAPARGATGTGTSLCVPYGHFNPRSREGSDIRDCDISREHVAFQSTLPRGERRGRQQDAFWDRHFNPRSREGSDVLAPFGSITSIKISIHAPARGATTQPADTITKQPFQSTLPRGERLFQHSPFCERERDFNPRSREGSDTAVCGQCQTYAYFNPRSREGSDCIY